MIPEKSMTFSGGDTGSDDASEADGGVSRERENELREGDTSRGVGVPELGVGHTSAGVESSSCSNSPVGLLLLLVRFAAGEESSDVAFLGRFRDGVRRDGVRR